MPRYLLLLVTNQRDYHSHCWPYNDRIGAPLQALHLGISWLQVHHPEGGIPGAESAATSSAYIHTYLDFFGSENLEKATLSRVFCQGLRPETPRGKEREECLL